MISHEKYAHTNEIRYLAGYIAVKELPENDWGKCKKIYPISERKQPNRMRGYQAIDNHPNGLFKKGDFIRILPASVHATKGIKYGRAYQKNKHLPEYMI